MFTELGKFSPVGLKMKLSIFAVIVIGAVLATVNANPHPLPKQAEERANGEKV